MNSKNCEKPDRRFIEIYFLMKIVSLVINNSFITATLM
jgi:hypothetical protein